MTGKLASDFLSTAAPAYARLRDLTVPLQVDGHISARALHPRWHGVDATQAVYFARVAMEKAVIAAEGARAELDVGEHIEEWARVGALARAASRSTASLLRTLSGSYHAERGTETLLPALHQMLAHQRPTLKIAERRRLAAECADTLIRAEAIISEFATHTGKRHREISAKRRNAGDPAKAAFVGILAEGWVFLTGALPGAYKDIDQNPFLRFVTAAWADLSETPSDKVYESFVQGLRTARVRLAAIPGFDASTYRPSWSN